MGVALLPLKTLTINPEFCHVCAVAVPGVGLVSLPQAL